MMTRASASCSPAPTFIFTRRWRSRLGWRSTS
jgi:hypothetical protein